MMLRGGWVPVLLQLLQEEPELLHVVRLDVVHALLRVDVDPHLLVVGRNHSLADIEFA
jgi:hypothetical protein